MLLVSEPTIGPDEKAVLAEVMDSGWITMGDRVHAFEKEFAQRQGVAGAVAVSSGTAALHLILEAFGIGPGDEVLVPSLTFVATANCVLYSGASPVFVDIESVEWPLMDRSDAAAKCTNRTRALIVVHYAGAVADIAEWQEFARARNLLLIEDAAHATGVDLVGTMGDAAAFSFYGNKNMTTAEGGAVIAKRGDILAKIRQMRGHGMTTGTFQRYASRSVGYDVTMLRLQLQDGRAARGHRLSSAQETHAMERQAEGIDRMLPPVLTGDVPPNYPTIRDVGRDVSHDFLTSHFACTASRVR